MNQVVASGIGGMVAGAIGAAVANSSDSYPVLKGALVVGAIDAVLTAVFIAASDTAKSNGQLSGVGRPPPRFL